MLENLEPCSSEEAGSVSSFFFCLNFGVVVVVVDDCHVLDLVSLRVRRCRE